LYPITQGKKPVKVRWQTPWSAIDADIAVIPIWPFFPPFAVSWLVSVPIGAEVGFKWFDRKLSSWLQTLFIFGAIGVLVLLGRFWIRIHC